MSKAKAFDSSIVTDRYAAAFLELAEKHDLLDKFDLDLALVKETFISNNDLKDFLEHPLIQSNDKKEVIDKIFREHISVYTLNLMKLLIDKNRFFMILHLVEHYKKLLNKKRNISNAQIITAIEIDEEVKNTVKQKLERVFSKNINIETVVDKEIIAGMIVKIDDKILDGSIKTKLENMKRQLI